VPSLGEIMRRAIQGHFEGFMNHDEVRAMVREAGMEVYSHSAAHQACFINPVRQGTLGDNLHWSHEPCAGRLPRTPLSTPSEAPTHMPASALTGLAAL
jgi:hypothetical protein